MKYRIEALDNQGHYYDLWAASLEDAERRLKNNDPTGQYICFFLGGGPKYLDYQALKELQALFPHTWREVMPVVDQAMKRYVEEDADGEAHIEAEEG